MRLSGLMSGMDTESIISQLVEARKTKVDKTKKAQTKLQWKQDAWKDLNTKLKNLQSKYLSSMRFASTYSKKVTKVSDPNAVSVITGEDAVNGVQSLKIDKLAKTGYLTGGSIEKDGTRFTALSKLSDLGVTGSGKINVSTGDASVDIQIDGNTTISDVLTQLKNAGLNANFDENNQRLFISSKESGAKSDFSLTALDQGGLDALKALGIQETVTFAETDPDKMSAVQKEYKKYADFVAGDRDATLANMSSLIAKDVQSRTDSYLAKYKSLVESRAADQKAIDDLEAKYKGADGNSTLKSKKEYEDALKAKNEEIAAKEEALKNETDPEQKRALEEELTGLKKEANELTTQKNDRETLDSKREAVVQADKDIANIESYVNITETEKDGQKVYSAEAKDKLKDEVADRFYQKAMFAKSVVDNGGISGNATKVNGQDAEIELNGAKFTSKDNTFKINGLTFTALNETNGSQITVTTQQDTDGIYDMVKNFLKEYNAIINEMDKLYNADSAKGYEPLTSEEKEALSDSEVEEYEKKIKNALLRRDENLSSVSSTLKAAMSGGVEVGGKTMYLHDFGIETLGYFEAPDNEKNAYHIFGDPDDSDTAGKSDVLRSMIANDPDTVISFFTKLSQNLYDEMTNMSKSVDGYRSFGSFYDDKKMKADYDNYTVKIKDQEQKLNDYEDKWYKKFAAMESAMAKMQSSANAVTSLLGGS